MSQLPKIMIADLLTGTRVGMLTARITEVEVFTQISKFSKPPGQTVNVYKLTLIDKTGTITYSDWCKMAGVQRSYKKGQIIRFHHAKLKLSTNVDPNTGQLYPPNVTVEKSTIIELLNSNGDAPVPKNLTLAPSTMAPITGMPPVASAVVPQVAALIDTMVVAQSTPSTEWLNVQAQYPNFYNAVDVLFGEIWKVLVSQPNITEYIENTHKGLMDMIWGPQ